MDKKNENKSEDVKQKEEYEGFDLYPERRSSAKSYSWFDAIVTSAEGRYKYFNKKCEDSVLNAFKNNPLIKVLTSALKENRCPFNLKRNIVCEECSFSVTGGYDSEFYQIVICQNARRARKYTDSIIIHELIHMYDRCVNETDFTNLDHLACSEIRAANLAHCSFMSSLLLLESTPINIKKMHQYCVKSKAAHSVMTARNVDLETAMEAILRVFDRCYNDLEPIGRRIKRNSMDPHLAYKKGVHFGFCQ